MNFRSIPGREVASFDLFDTVLGRATAEPADVFRLLYLRLAEQQPELRRVPMEEFVWCRQHAERQALGAAAGEETTLAEVAARLSTLIPRLNPDQLAALELEIEAGVIFPVKRIAGLIRQAREAGRQVIFVSDTYLPEDFLANLLDRHGLRAPEDRLYISSTHRLAKRTGSLFRHVISDLATPPGAIQHHGDNHHSDILQARAAGLRTVHIRDTDLNAAESALRHRAGLGKVEQALLVGLSKAYRLRDTETAPHPLVSGLIGPASVLLATWLLRRASARGATQLLFCARDLYFPWKVARRLSPQLGLPAPVRLQYLLVSRQSLYLPTLATRNTLPEWLLRPWDCPDEDALARKLGFPDSSALSASSRNILQRLSKAPDARSFAVLCDELHAEPEVRSRYLRAAQHLRHYLRRLRLSDNEPLVGFADLGWTRRTQGYFHLALQDIRPPGQVTVLGLYLGLSAQRCPPAEGLESETLFYEEPRREPRDSFCPHERVMLLEHLLGAPPHGKVSHYGASGAACFSDGSNARVDRETIVEINTGLIHYLQATAILAPFLRALGESELKATLHACLEHFFTAPTRETAALAARFRCSSDQNDVGLQPLCAPLTLAGAILFHRTRDHLPWPEAALALSSPVVRMLARFNLGLHSLYRRARRRSA
jgi:FMN phosphatase YigB (HAD superfamily)